LDQKEIIVNSREKERTGGREGGGLDSHRNIKI
jgi:hypothetical protein